MVLRFLIISLVLMLTACGSTTPSKFYLLTSKQATSRPKVAKSRQIIGLGPVTLPRYLDQDQMVTRVKSQEVHLAEYHRWAEPLDDNVERVLNDDLTTLLPNYEVHKHPWKGDVNLQ